MATTAQSQHRCVFVGNIPYDATEEQLIQICKEVGPVVSFRLVIDRETGKPKGYGFCEYQDEETALSARRNLQGYDINGRQLRVDFAENDKNNDKSREQGRGGPGIVSTADPQKQLGVPAALRDLSFHHPLGDSVATAAATVMAGSLGLQNQTLLGTDPLTRHLAKMSRSQLTEIMSEMKEMAMQDKEQARKLLLAIPNLPKALFQAQIMLGMVPPQMLLMPNILQASVQPEQPILQNGQALPGLPPLPQNRLQYGISPYTQETQVSSGVSNPYATAPQFPAPSQIQSPQLVQNQALSLSSVRSQPVGGLSARPQIHVPSSASMNQPQQPSLPQHVGQVLPIHSISGYNGNVIGQNASTLTSALTRPQFPVDGFQPSSSTSAATPENMDLKGRGLNLTKKTTMANNSTNQINRAPKMVKLNDGRASASSQANLAAPISAAAPQTSHVSVRQTIKEETPNAGAQVTQMQLPSDVDSALLEQVLNLTPEQLNSLPPDQRQQVIQLQQMLRQAA